MPSPGRERARERERRVLTVLTYVTAETKTVQFHEPKEGRESEKRKDGQMR